MNYLKNYFWKLNILPVEIVSPNVIKFIIPHHMPAPKLLKTASLLIKIVWNTINNRVSPWIRFSNWVVKRELVCDSNVGKSVCSEISDVAPIVDEVVVVIVVAVVEGLVVVVLGSTGIT